MPPAQQVTPPGMWREMPDIPIGLLRPVLVTPQPSNTFLVRQLEEVIYDRQDRKLHWLLRGTHVQYRAKCGSLAPGWVELIADQPDVDLGAVREDFALLHSHLATHQFDISAHFWTGSGPLDLIALDPEHWPAADDLRGCAGASFLIHPPRGVRHRVPLCPGVDVSRA